MIYLAELVCPNDLQDFINLKQKIDSHLASIRYRYEKLANILARMLETDETRRMDFLELIAALQEVQMLQGYIQEKSEGANTQQMNCSEEESDLVGVLQACYEKEEWNLMETVLSTKAAQLDTVEAQCKLKMCPNCYLEVNSVRVCPNCRRPTGLDNCVRQ